MAGEDRDQVAGAEVPGQDLAEQIAEVGGDGQVPAILALPGRELRVIDPVHPELPVQPGQGPLTNQEFNLTGGRTSGDAMEEVTGGVLN